MNLNNAKNALDHYYDQTGSCIMYQDGGTTLVSVGCVLLALILAKTQSPDLTAHSPAFPLISSVRC